MKLNPVKFASFICGSRPSKLSKLGSWFGSFEMCGEWTLIWKLPSFKSAEIQIPMFSKLYPWILNTEMFWMWTLIFRNSYFMNLKFFEFFDFRSTNFVKFLLTCFEMLNSKFQIHRGSYLLFWIKYFRIS